MLQEQNNLIWCLVSYRKFVRFEHSYFCRHGPTMCSQHGIHATLEMFVFQILLCYDIMSENMNFPEESFTQKPFVCS